MGVTVAMTALLAIGLLFALTGPVLSQEAGTAPEGGYIYTVQEGDSWDIVALKTGVDVATLQEANPDAVRDTGWLLSGEQLAIPAVGDAESQTHVVGAGESWASIAEEYGVSVNLLFAANPDRVRPGLVLYQGEKLVIPAAPSAATETPAAVEPAAETPEPVVTEEATEAVTEEAAEPVETEEAAETPEPAVDEEPVAPVTVPLTVPVSSGDEVTGTETLTDTEGAPEAEPVSEIPACPEAFADYPDLMVEVLNAAGGDAAALEAFLDECGAAVEGGVVPVDLGAEEDAAAGADADAAAVAEAEEAGAQALVVVYQNPVQQAAFVEGDLLILSPGANGYAVAYRARAAGEVRLLAVEDINADGLPDVVWVDTTCGASTCFDTVNVRSWDGSVWADWTEGTITMAYADIALVEAETEGEAAQLELSGGIYGSVGAGPQRSRTEIWASVDGAPYQLVEKTYADSECLYHTVLDANRALLDAPVIGFETATALYETAATDESLMKCWVRADEMEELRSFSLFRLALIAAYQEDIDTAEARIAELGVTYPGSIYDDVGQVWLESIAAEGDVAAACEAAAAYVAENSGAWEILADYGYTNPSFGAADVCPVLNLSAPDAEEQESEETGATDALPQSDPGSGASASLPECAGSLAGYAEVLPAVLAATQADQEALENWLQVCGVLAEDRGAALFADLNQDGADDVVVFPTLISDVGLGPKGAQGAVYVFHSQPDGSLAVAFSPEIYGKPALLGAGDLNADGQMDIAWTVEGCATSCVLEAQVWTWDGAEYVSMIEPGAVIALGTATFEPVKDGDPGGGHRLVLVGGVSDTLEGGLAVPHQEVWQSIDGAPFRRISWTYDRTAGGNDCMGLRLVEADAALLAADVIGYARAAELYAAALADELQACSIFGLRPDEELALLQGLAHFRLMQVQHYAGDDVAAQATLDDLAAAQPDSLYAQAAASWQDAIAGGATPADACAAVEPIFTDNPDLWQITDHFGYSHPALAAEQICFVP